MKLSIDLSPQQHQHLKAAAALEGKTIKAYVLERAFSGMPDSSNQDLSPLEKVLNARMTAARQGSISSRSVEQIFDETLKEAGH